MLLGDNYTKTPMSIQVGKVYKIVNKINNKVYIGCTINSLNERFYEHLYRCFKTDYKSKLYSSIKKYGKENFEIILLEECSSDVLYKTEKKYIIEYNSYEQGMNSTFGGEGCLGYQHSSEIKEKISKNLKNGKSHRGKTYEEIYGENKNKEKEKRKESVKKYWNKLSKEEKNKRINKATETIRKKSKLGVELIKEIKNKINNGATNKELKKQYPQIKRVALFSEIRKGRRWKNL